MQRRTEGYRRYREALAAAKQAEQQPVGGKDAADGGGMHASNGVAAGGSRGAAATSSRAGWAAGAAAAAAEHDSIAAEEGGLGGDQPSDRQSIRLPPRQRRMFSCFRVRRGCCWRLSSWAGEGLLRARGKAGVGEDS